jgi:Mlc titration factor MtfA (ptsG expression regulator)
MLARIIAIPFMICALTFLYFTMTVDSKYGLYIVPFVVALAVIYTLSPQINWWWYQRNPPDLKAGVRRFFERFFPYYQRLSEQEQKRFRHRVALLIEANNFVPKGMEDVTEDMKAAAVANLALLTFGFKDFLLSRFENVVLAPKPFPSPQYPKNYHTSEIYEEDGAVLFAVEQLFQSFIEPHRYYSIGLHEYSKAFVRSYPDIEWPALPKDIWQNIAQISGMDEVFIENYINLRPIPARPVSIVHFFLFPTKFQALMPDLYQQYSKIFNQSPVLGRFPVQGALIALKGA